MAAAPIGVYVVRAAIRSIISYAAPPTTKKGETKEREIVRWRDTIKFMEPRIVKSSSSIK